MNIEILLYKHAQATQDKALNKMVKRNARAYVKDVKQKTVNEKPAGIKAVAGSQST